MTRERSPGVAPLGRSRSSSEDLAVIALLQVRADPLLLLVVRGEAAVAAQLFERGVSALPVTMASRNLPAPHVSLPPARMRVSVSWTKP
jgi:hypothetical protein